MNYPNLFWGSLAIAVSIAVPSLAQISPPNADPAAQLEEQTTTAPDGRTETVTEPLEVDQQQTDQFFRPAPRPQIVERTTSSSSEREDLIEPPPGSQTPAEVTPGQRLNLQIR
jgi:hypothetical protein